jgi:hypothetical protein
MKALLLVSMLVLTVLAGCAATPRHSDFLGDLSGFQRMQNGRDTIYWIAPGLTRPQVESYRAVIVEPVSLSLSENSEHKGIRADEGMALAGYFRNALVDALQDRYTVVSQAGPNVLRIRPAITDIHRNKPITPMEFTPVGLALKGVETVTGMPSPRELLLGPSPFNQASVEMEFLDATSGQRLAAFRDTRKAKGDDASKKDVTWGQVKETLDGWARDVRRTLDDPRKPG